MLHIKVIRKSDNQVMVFTGVSLCSIGDKTSELCGQFDMKLYRIEITTP